MNKITELVIKALDYHQRFVIGWDEHDEIEESYDGLSHDPQEWFQHNETLWREANDLEDGLGQEIWNFGYNNIEWDIIKEHFRSDYEDWKQKREEENENESDSTDSDDE